MIATVGGVSTHGVATVTTAAPDAKTVKESPLPHDSTMPRDTVEISDEARRLSMTDTEESGSALAASDLEAAPTAETEPVDNVQQALERLKILNSGDSFGRDEAMSEMERMQRQLENLRSVFGDDVAMDAFDDRMNSFGYTFSIKVGPGTLLLRPSKTNGIVMLGYGEGGRLSKEESNYNSDGSLKFKLAADYDPERGYGTVSIMREGKTEATYAAFNSYRDPGYEDAKRVWNERTANFPKDAVGFDVEEYVAGLANGLPFAVESVSTDLADAVSSILHSAGVTLEKGQEFTLLAEKIDGEYVFLAHTNFGNESFNKKLEETFLKTFEKDPSLKERFTREYESVELYDIDSFPGQYYSENRSVFYTQQRQFVYSGDESSAVVMGSRMNLRQTGDFIYLKEFT